MDELVLYHGSKLIVTKPELASCRPHNDYGAAFYCSESLELAKEWACGLGTSGIANSYRLDTAGLNILHLNEPPYTILHWLAVLAEHRVFRISSPTMERAGLWLLEGFAIDLASFDVVHGYRADDSYFSFARAFLRNEITLGQLSKAMSLGELGEQWALRSEKALEALEFMDFEMADAAEWWPRRNARDLAAREGYAAIVGQGVDGRALYVSTLMAMGEEELDAVLS